MKKILMINFILFISQFLQAACYVKVNLSCKSVQAPWETKSLLARSSLLHSNEVQNQMESCQRFAQLIKTECQILQPVQSVFTTLTQKKITTFAVQLAPSLFTQRATLPKSFQDYFADNGHTATLANNSVVFVKLGTTNFNSITNFINTTNNNNVLKIPMACNSGSDYTTKCGYQVSCIAASYHGVGEILEVKKVGVDSILSTGETALCSYNTTLDSILSRMGQLTKYDDGKERVLVEQTPVTNYSGFGKMPLLNQVDPWLQGLLLDKYGINYAQTGVCLATSLTMMAVALKGESLQSYLGTLFDVLPNEYGDGTSKVPVPGKQGQFKELKYSHYATYIDQMLRMGGLLHGTFPWYFKNYHPLNTGFYRAKYLDQGDALPSSHNGQSTHLYVEKNLKSWINSKHGVVLGLKGNGQIAASKDTEGVYGHANTVVSHSGTVITLLDPWGVVNQVQFAWEPDQITVTQNDTNECNNFKKQYPSSALNCFPPGTYQNLKKNYILLHVGAPLSTSPYGGNGYIGAKFINENYYQGATVVGYYIAEPFPKSFSFQSVRDSHKSTNVLSQVNSTGNTCTAVTKGLISISGKNYSYL